MIDIVRAVTPKLVGASMRRQSKMPHPPRLQLPVQHILRLEIDRLSHALNGTEDCRARMPRYVLAAEVPQELRYQALAQSVRYAMDSLRMPAYRAELVLARQLDPLLSNPETANEAVCNTLYASKAGPVPDNQAGILNVLLPHQSRTCLDEALGPLLAEVNNTQTAYPGTNLRLVSELVSG